MGERDPTFFYVDLWSRLLELQIHGEAMSAEAPGTTNDRKKQPMTFELRPSTGAAGGRDAHWADPTSLELLDLIVEPAPSLPLLAIVTFRPEFAAPWIGRSQVTLISLNRLPRRLRAEMIAQITGGKGAARDAGGRNWCPIFYSAEARRTRSEFIGDSRVTGNGLPSSLKRGRTVVNIDVLYVVSIWLLRVLIAVTFHEAAHGYVARFLGDDTASRLGRVSLNPFRHIDPFGTILLPGLLLLARSPFLFGYAKPVPINFRALRSPRIGMVLVAAAGPAMNIGLAIIAVSPGRLFASYHLTVDRPESKERPSHQCPSGDL